jgi:hypothetical protein
MHKKNRSPISLVGTLRSFGSRHIHEVASRGVEPAVSVHVHAPSLVEMLNTRCEATCSTW